MDMSGESLRIGIVARDLEKTDGGTGVMLDQLLRRLDTDAHGHRIYIIHRSPGLGKAFSHVHATVRRHPKPVFDFVDVPIWTHRNKLDVVVYPKNVIPWGVRGKRILIVLDLAYFWTVDQRHAYPLMDRLFMTRMMTLSSRRADSVAAISHNTRTDLHRQLGLDPEKTMVLPLAAAECFTPVTSPSELDRVRSLYRLPERFILFTGGLSPRKNIVRLIEAFQLIQGEYPGLHLILTGGRGWRNAEEAALIEANPRIRRLGSVPGQDLPALYSLASLCAYPSLYEGFGIPVLEAQACGCPVLASNVSSIPEVAGDGAHYADPYSAHGIAAGCRAILDDDAYRDALIQKGFHNKRRYSWDESAAILLKLCEAIN